MLQAALPNERLVCSGVRLGDAFSATVSGYFYHVLNCDIPTSHYPVVHPGQTLDNTIDPEIIILSILDVVTKFRSNSFPEESGLIHWDLSRNVGYPWVVFPVYHTQPCDLFRKIA